MLRFFRLRVLTLVTMTLLATGCGQKEGADPQPNKLIQVANAAKYHTVAVRYHVKSLGDSSQLPTIPPNIEVDYERVVYQSPATYRLLAPGAQLYDQGVNSTVKEVQLAPIGTYAGEVKPRITITIWVDEAPAAGSGAGYQVICELLIDGRVAGGATYPAVAGTNSPLYVSSQTQVAH